MHLFTLFMEVKTNQDRNIRDRDASSLFCHESKEYVGLEYKGIKGCTFSSLCEREESRMGSLG
jgi:hypothetical protein